MIGLMLVAMMWIYFVVPESPTFLFEINDFEKLEISLLQIAKINGVRNYKHKIKDLVFKLKIDKQRDVSFTSNIEETSNKKVEWNSTDKKNLFACCYLWSMSGFVTYLIVYYSKYFEGNFYVNYSLQGFADCISLFYVMILQKRY